MKTLHHVTRTVSFYVLAEDEKEAEQLGNKLCQIDNYPMRALLDTRVYRTPNQSVDFIEQVAVNESN